VKHDAAGAKGEACPVKHEENTNSIANYMGWLDQYNPLKRPAPVHQPLRADPKTGYNEKANDFHFDQSVPADQKVKLSKDRATSTIPKTEFTPHHQPDEAKKWVYPSEQQYYNAMRRKGYNPDAKDVPAVLSIHNIVNEQGWSKIKAWEAFRGCDSPRLVKFCGRPQDLSPKAYFMNLIGYELPFDRHDWIIESNGRQTRYVIDFYKGRRVIGMPVSMYLDVRPALDSPTALWDRTCYAMKNYFKPHMKPKS
jgi:cytochrome c heme-lyase